ncbi:hypothetical protein AgCh_040037 [Apium graveolens]
MSARKLNSIKILVFDKVNYTLWKKKMMFFIRIAHPLYLEILKYGPFIPIMRVPEATEGDIVIPGHYDPKDPSTYTEPGNEKVSLNSILLLILTESLNNVMYNIIINWVMDLSVLHLNNSFTQVPLRGKVPPRYFNAIFDLSGS